MERRYERSETLEDVGRVKAARPEKLGKENKEQAELALKRRGHMRLQCRRDLQKDIHTGTVD